jgi:type I restriction enzyme M protein
MAKAASKKSTPTRTLEQTLWDAADKMRGSLEAGEYKHVVVSPVFLKYVSDTFPASRQWVMPEGSFKSCGIQIERR